MVTSLEMQRFHRLRPCEQTAAKVIAYEAGVPLISLFSLQDKREVALLARSRFHYKLVKDFAWAAASISTSFNLAKNTVTRSITRYAEALGVPSSAADLGFKRAAA